ncbi:hypothetical protein FACS1894181_01380 [Bacteroidia bacterium]|nr:hypothetical protein FACS1894181_01380 [Bacteroidia bacterium]
MRILLRYIYKVFKQIRISIVFALGFLDTLFLFYVNGVKHKKIKALGKLILNVSLGGNVIIDDNLYIRNYSKYSDTSDNRPTKILVSKNAFLIIGKNVGLTSTTIVCQQYIQIGNNVLIGGGTAIYDTNFHPVFSSSRMNQEPIACVQTKSVIINDNVFIGTSCIILKGVTIGENSVVAAGSVVVKSIPPNEMWGGNPAVFLKRL